MRIELVSDGGRHFDTLTRVTADVFRSCTGDLIDVTGHQGGRLLTLIELVAACEHVDEAERGRPALRVVR